jgi:hypothetical protein
MYTNSEKCLVEHGSVDLSLSHGHFGFWKKKWKIKYKSLHRKVFICKPLIPTLQITAFITVNYKNNCCPCASIHCTVHLSTDLMHALKYPTCVRINWHLLPTLCFGSTTSWTAVAYSVVSVWPHKWVSRGFKSNYLAGCIVVLPWHTPYSGYCSFKDVLTAVLKWGAATLWMNGHSLICCRTFCRRVLCKSHD